MRHIKLRTAAVAIALLATASVAGPSLAAPPGGSAGTYHPNAGSHSGQAPDTRDMRDRDDDNGWNDGGNQDRFEDRDYGRGFNDTEFSERDRFYYHGDARQRYQRLQHFANYLARSHQISRYEARRAFRTLDSIRYQAFQFRRDGFMSWREKRVLNARLDELAAFLRHARHDGDERWGYNR